MDPLLPNLDFSRAFGNLESEGKSSDFKNRSSLKIITSMTTVHETKQISLLVGNGTQAAYVSPSLCVHIDPCQLTFMYYFSLSSNDLFTRSKPSQGYRIDYKYIQSRLKVYLCNYEDDFLSSLAYEKNQWILNHICF